MLLPAVTASVSAVGQQLEVSGSIALTGSEAEQAQHAEGQMTDMPGGARRCAIRDRVVMHCPDVCIGIYSASVLAHGTARAQLEAAPEQLSSTDFRAEGPPRPGELMINQVSLAACMHMTGHATG